MFNLKYRFQDVSFTTDMTELLNQMEKINWFTQKKMLGDYSYFNLKIISNKETMIDYFVRRNYSYENSLTSLYLQAGNNLNMSVYSYNSNMRDGTWSRLGEKIDKNLKNSSLNTIKLEETFIKHNKITVSIRIASLLKLMFFEKYYQQYFENIPVFGLKVLPLLEKGYTIIGWD